MKSTVTINKKYKHEGEVNRARAMPQDNSIIATASNHGTVYLYNTTSTSDENDEGTYYAALEYHKENGYGLSWNNEKKGHLLTGSDDSTVALWDITAESKTPISTYTDAKDIVNDVSWQNRGNSNLFGVVSEDHHFYFYDTRTDIEKGPSIKKKIHDDAINSLAFSCASEYVFATGGSDNNVVLSDLRNLDIRLHTLIGHSDNVTSLKWSPHDDRILASAGTDRRLIMWDIGRVGEEQSQEDTEDGAPELLFMHAGHTSGVSDFSFSESQPWLVASVSEDNICQVWQPKPAVVGRDKPHVLATDLE